MSLTSTILTVAALLAVSAIFCAAEIALLSASKARLNLLARQGNKRAQTALDLLKHPDQMLATILIIMTIIPVASSALTTSAALGLFGPVGAAYATAGLGLLILLAAEAFPKALGTRFPETIALALARPMAACMWLLYPLTLGVKYFNSLLLALLGLGGKQAPAFTEADIRGAIAMGAEHGALSPAQHRMLESVLDLSELTVADVMIHRSAIEGVDISTPAAQLPATLGKLRHSRVVVFDGQPENLAGILHVADYLNALAGVSTRHEVTLQPHLRPLYFIPDTTPVSHQLLEFLRLHLHLALVVDEYGDVLGLITLEDILEEIVGDIADEHEAARKSPEKAEDGALILPGATPVRDANRKHKWKLPETDAVTLAGLMTETLGHLPIQGESVTLGKLTLTVTNRRGHRIEKIKITRHG